VGKKRLICEIAPIQPIIQGVNCQYKGTFYPNDLSHRNRVPRIYNAMILDNPIAQIGQYIFCTSKSGAANTPPSQFKVSKIKVVRLLDLTERQARHMGVKYIKQNCIKFYYNYNTKKFELNSAIQSYKTMVTEKYGTEIVAKNPYCFLFTIQPV
ncbi:MAG: hypothetical protein R3279_07540, partial [Putridiphycobacter sp.]|nr:hypothetical protein [Putridiphycobacter sp.]